MDQEETLEETLEKTLEELLLAKEVTMPKLKESKLADQSKPKPNTQEIKLLLDKKATQKPSQPEIQTLKTK